MPTLASVFTAPIPQVLPASDPGRPVAIRAIGRADVPRAQRRLVATSGASTAVTDRDGVEQIEVRDAQQRLVFCFDPVTGKGIVSAPAGDLTLHAPQGNIDLVAGRSIRCRSEEQICLEAGPADPAPPCDVTGTRRSSLVLGPALATLRSGALRLLGQHAEVAIDETSYRGQRLAASLEEAKLVVTRLETVANRLLERAKSVFRTVEDLHQLRAGRMRTIAEQSYYLRGGHASLEADDDMKIDGKSIQLG
jgi:hypothetical protein